MGDLPDYGYRPLNATLDSRAALWHGARLLILSPQARHAAPTRSHPPAPRTPEPEPRPPNPRFPHKRFPPTHTRAQPNHRPSRSAQTISLLARPNPSPAPPPAAWPERSLGPHPNPRAFPITSRLAPCRLPTHRHPSVPPHPAFSRPATSPASPARPPSLCSGSRPCAAPGPPSGSLPESRYRPVKITLDFAAVS